MKYNSKIVKLFCYLLCATSYVCFAQPITQFNHITVEDGLSQSSVLSITQDKTGFMWFSTLDVYFGETDHVIPWQTDHLIR